MLAPKNEIIFDRDFIKDMRKLPNDIQDRLGELTEILREDPFDSRLHTKPLSMPLQGMFSFRVKRDYRAGFRFRASRVIQLLLVGKRDKIYQRLRKKL